jgi:hypothetical protein
VCYEVFAAVRQFAEITRSDPARLSLEAVRCWPFVDQLVDRLDARRRPITSAVSDARPQLRVNDVKTRIADSMAAPARRVGTAQLHGVQARDQEPKQISCCENNGARGTEIEPLYPATRARAAHFRQVTESPGTC